MPEPRRLRICARTLGTITGPPNRPLGGYSYRGWELDPIPGEMTPRQIVAILHAEIAAMSPEHAVLVSMFERLCARPPSWDPEGEYATAPVRSTRSARDRRQQWRELRQAGVSKADAAAELGISRRTADRYEDLLTTLGCAA